MRSHKACTSAQRCKPACTQGGDKPHVSLISCKARSARELQQKLGRSILVCVGDGENDLSMLQAADFAYSPADGVVADRFENVCNCADGSVADVIYEKIPNILNFHLDKRE